MKLAKRLAVALLAALQLVLAGCLAPNGSNVEPTNVQKPAFAAFNDEHYVWEEWFFGTNKVYKIED